MSNNSRLDIKGKPPDTELQNCYVQAEMLENKIVPDSCKSDKSMKLIFDIGRKSVGQLETRIAPIIVNSMFNTEIVFKGRPIEKAYNEYIVQVPSNAVEDANPQKVLLYIPNQRVISAAVKNYLDEKFKKITRQLTVHRYCLSADEYLQMLVINRNLHDDCDALIMNPETAKSGEQMLKDIKDKVMQLWNQHQAATNYITEYEKQLEDICLSVNACVSHYDNVLTIIEQ